MTDRKVDPKLSDPANPRFHPSPTMRVRFADGKVVAMNRKERRRAHLYGDRLVRGKQ